MARTRGVGSGMRVKATGVEVKTASPSTASRDGPSVRRKGVRRIGWGLMPGEEGFRTGSGEGKESLEAILIAAEETFRFQGFEIELIKKGAITVRRRADSGKKDGIGVLADHPGAVRELAVNRIAGVLVMLILGQIPE